jgi:hypothetical protein
MDIATQPGPPRHRRWTAYHRSHRSMVVGKVQGTVGSVRVDEEKHATVLRFVVASGEEQIPVEMRGQEIKGVLEVGHEVAIEAPDGRDPDGVLRPKAVENLTTSSRVVVSQTLMRRLGRFMLDLSVSIAAGVVSTVAATLVMPGGVEARGVSAVPRVVAVAIGLAVAVLVFYLIAIRRRRVA